ncbi:ABC-type Fe3+ transport system permease subunit [Curtobacterium flaccumfaciens]|uniref:ABC-type Fe3+ transport system permease subunit n=1 Tax=Curtobacterium salicis TaxID=1779862 RepID=A0ABX0T995_9MICO|nr:hypothetical protein [Curtobacterium sp. WW7]NII42100.1 ABC-type Fe3+ transport system permease subunit [Curtobacterium sp. WW7]
MRLIQLSKRLFAASIWGPTGVDAEDERVRWLLRVGLPLFDVFCIGFGVFGYAGGIPALRDSFGEGYAQSFGLTLSVTALVCLVGIAFPALLWRMEFCGKCLLLGLLMLYAVSVFLAGAVGGDLGRGGVGFAILAMAVVPAWRVSDIARDRVVHQWK